MVNSFVTVATFTNSLEANLAKQRLEAEGVKCLLLNESTVNVAWHLSVAVGWIQLQVPEVNVDLAKSILVSELDYESSSNSDIEQDDEDDDFPITSWADKTADRAFITSVISLIFVFLPIQLYSLWLLLSILISRQNISENRYIKVIVALLLDLLSLFIVWKIYFSG
ncbi:MULTISPECIES: putative signal transducing protein [Cyanophyceae]|uniref:DUF2007 domain-containing protein n=1 Tax=Nodularia spumigena CENA596 TaxID=1819295 RepID=A0A166J5H9_NODSP|nr:MULTISPECIES: DUF2007 domain-containing protein [Cyanophyceae]MDB9355239.1 DUF2007 domain-containing protein [Nodularia spumigena CS-587/03]KZL49250.1 hypothetical protein A2T98_13740 [Nodularia spumigena CENA596]MDB9305202.1 DUF2007 domain-containing protein [Nodularia spumigena CS-591/12]MDB9341873.1 DUF2007 domain-containing protein [Nodularia spumigena CS-589/07]MDB9345541.1 DUF2007 domain-containing protein [Nodularia spumigena CS-588/06]